MWEKRRRGVIGYFSDCRLPWIIAGIVVAILSLVPYFILGDASVVTYHDQLDGELITYLLNAKHLFEGLHAYPEIMNGIPVNGMVSPAPLFIFLYRLFSPFTAFVISMAIVRLASVISMFLFLDELTDNKVISFLSAILFMLLPFYTVYGLCIPGQPVLYYAYMRFKRDKWEWPLYFAIAFYAGTSSFALCGYAVLVIMGILFIVTIIRKEHPVRHLLSCVVLVVVYVGENLPLVKQALGLTEGFVSHKSEIVKSGVPFMKGLLNLLWTGANYTEGYQKYYILVIAFAMIFGCIYIFCTAGDKDEIDVAYNRLFFVTVSLLLLSAITAVLESPKVVSLQNGLTGIIREFSFSRFSWLMTPLWIASFAMSLKLLYLMADNAGRPVLMKIVWALALVTSLGSSAFFAIYNSDLKTNVVKLSRHGDYYMMTWQQFFAEDLFKEVDEMIGEDKSQYHVASFGIYPAAAAYNGFYCMDAYSNNYDVNYKHAFNDVLAPELEKSDYLKAWFEGWGNRCYLVTKETMNYFTFEKKWGTYTTEYDWNLAKLKEMGCDYLISASYLIEPEAHGLTLLNDNDEAIETDGSWYRLFVYRIEESDLEEDENVKKK